MRGDVVVLVKKSPTQACGSMAFTLQDARSGMPQTYQGFLQGFYDPASEHAVCC